MPAKQPITIESFVHNILIVSSISFKEVNLPTLGMSYPHNFVSRKALCGIPKVCAINSLRASSMTASQYGKLVKNYVREIERLFRF